MTARPRSPQAFILESFAPPRLGRCLGGRGRACAILMALGSMLVGTAHLLAASGEAFDDKGETVRTLYESPHFRVVSPPPGVPNLEFYANLCEGALERLAPGLRSRPPGTGKMVVRVSPDGADFERVSERRADTAMAVAFPDKGVIVLNTELLRPAGAVERKRTIDHEMVHLLLGWAAEGEARVPMWLHEGLAQILAGPQSESSTIRLAWAQLFGRLLPMRSLIASFPSEGPKAPLAYAQSESFTQFTATKILGFDNAEAFFRFITQDPERAKTILARLSDGEIVDEVEMRWHHKSRGVQNWFLILSSSTLLWGLIVLLFIAAYIRKRRRERLVVQDWDPWERDEA
ncbi:MAG TPA: hypothetical protein VM492_04385 [Sumerlaeia bacterium]|nr:hypothetical protein [Sumerlaeia bacterium]